jgi:hypothetical protein
MSAREPKEQPGKADNVETAQRPHYDGWLTSIRTGAATVSPPRPTSRIGTMRPRGTTGTKMFESTFAADDDQAIARYWFFIAK